MTSEDAARATARAIGELGGAFMQDGQTYARGAEIGYSGIDFYVLGRGGVLGETQADVVAAAFVFWNPDQVAALWESGCAVQPPTAAAAEWVALCGAYGEAHLPDVDGLDRLIELTGKVVDAASPSAAPLFAGWRRQEAPGADRPKALAQYRLNALRELRGALHGGAVLAAGLTGQEALAFRAPQMAGIFGWDPENLPDAAAVKERWKTAEAGTNAAFGRALEALDDAERDEFVALVNATHAAVNAAKEA
jgi:hypothetical protein